MCWWYLSIWHGRDHACAWVCVTLFRGSNIMHVSLEYFACVHACIYLLQSQHIVTKLNQRPAWRYKKVAFYMYFESTIYIYMTLFVHDMICFWTNIYIYTPGHTWTHNVCRPHSCISAASVSVATFDDHITISTIAISTWGRGRKQMLVKPYTDIFIGWKIPSSKKDQ